MKSSFFHKTIQIILILAGLAFLTPLLALVINGSFMRLSGDDYCYRAVVRQVGFWADPIYSYFNVVMYSASRFSLTLLYDISSLLGPWVNGAQPGLAVVLWGIGLYGALRALSNLLGVPAGRLEVGLAAAAVEFFSLYYSPALEQVVYWQSAMLTYLAPLVVFTFVLGIILRSPQGRRFPWYGGVGLFLLSFLAGGFSETADALEVGLLGLTLLIVLWEMRRGKSQFKSMLLPVCVSMAGVLLALLVLFLSPNNHLRQVSLNLPPPPDLPTLIVDSFYNVRVFVSIAVRKQTLPNLGAVVFGFVLTGLILMRTQKRLRVNLRGWILGMTADAIVCLGLLFAIMTPSVYGQSSYPIARALINAQFVIVLGAVFAGGLTAVWWMSWFRDRILASDHRKAALGAALAACLLLTGFFPVQKALEQFSQTSRYQRWSVFWDQRDALIRDAAAHNQREIDVVEIDKIIPDIGELNANPDAFYNNCAEMYYGMEQIRATLPGWDPSAK